MSPRKERISLRTEVVRAGEQASVPLDDYDRAIILGQIAGLIAAHPKVGRRVAFKGGAIMHLVDGSPRLSRDLDGVMVAGGRISEAVVRHALSTPDARRIVKRIERFTMWPLSPTQRNRRKSMPATLTQRLFDEPGRLRPLFEPAPGNERSSERAITVDEPSSRGRRG